MSCGCGNPGCSGCASNCNSACNNNIGCSQVITPAPSCSVRPCSPLANCSCGTTPCTCGCGSPATPSPYYSNTPSCPEDHCQTINNYLFNTAIRTDISWVIPICGGTAMFTVSDLNVLHVGSYLWSSAYGYFEVVAFDSINHQVTIVNHCNEGNAAVGTLVSACSEFDVVDPPFAGDLPPGGAVCVAVDFTAPADGDCLLITLTSTAGIVVNDTIQIGDGQYTVGSIESDTLLTICNDGDGLVPGTPVIAKNEAGQFQYCINIVGNCCTTIQERFGGELTPCSDFENLGIIQQSTPAPVAGVVAEDGETVTTNIGTLTFQNTSECRTMQVMIAVFMVAELLGTLGQDVVQIRYEIQQKENAGAFTTAINGSLLINPSFDDLSSVLQSIFLSYHDVKSVAPGATLTLQHRAIITEEAGTGDGQTVNVTNFQIRPQGIGIAV